MEWYGGCENRQFFTHPKKLVLLHDSNDLDWHDREISKMGMKKNNRRRYDRRMWLVAEQLKKQNQKVDCYT